VAVAPGQGGGIAAFAGNPWAVVAEIGITVGLWAINKYLLAPPFTGSKYLSQEPHANEGEPLNLIFGRCRVRQPLFAWFGGYQTTGAWVNDNLIQGGGGPNYFNHGINMAFDVGIPMGPRATVAETNAMLYGMWIGEAYGKLGYQLPAQGGAISNGIPGGYGQYVYNGSMGYEDPPNYYGELMQQWPGTVGYVSFFNGGTDQLISNNNAGTLPTFQQAGPVSSGAGTALTVAYPTIGVADTAVLVVATQGQTPSLSTPAGFAQVGSTLNSGGSGIPCTMAVYLNNSITSTNPASPVVASNTNNQFAQIFTFRGISSLLYPVDQTMTATQQNTSNVTVPQYVNPLTEEFEMVATFVAYEVTSASPQSSNPSNPALSGLTLESDESTALGGGCACIVGATGTSEAAVPATTLSLATASNVASFSLAFKPLNGPVSASTYNDITDLAWFMRRSGAVGGQTITTQSNYVDVDPTTIPAYRGQLIVGLTGKHDIPTQWGTNSTPFPFWDAFYFYSGAGGGSTAIPQISFEVASYRYQFNQGWSTNQDADPASVLYDIIVEKWGKVGIADPTQVNTASFLTASTTLLSENNGYSRCVDSLVDARELVQDICNQICGTVYVDPVTGLLTLKLIRDDYGPISGIPQFTEAQVVSVEENTVPSWRNVANAVRVKFYDRTNAYNEASALAQNTASAMMQSTINGSLGSGQNGQLRTVTVEYKGCCSAANAQNLAQRDLSLLSVPLQQIRLTMNRQAATLRPGSVFLLTMADYPSLANGVVFRVTDVDLGQLGQSTVKVTAMQDVFSVGQGAAYSPPLPWQIYVPSPCPLTTRLEQMAPRQLMNVGVQSGAWPSADQQRVWFLASPDDASSSYQATDRKPFSLISSPTFTVDLPLTGFPAHGTVAAAYDRSLGPYDISTGILISGLSPAFAAQLVETSFSYSDVETSGYPLMLVGGNEIMAWTSVQDTSGTGAGPWLFEQVWRAMLDTAAHDHVVGEDVYFIGVAFSATAYMGSHAWADNTGAIQAVMSAKRGSVLGSGADPTDNIAIVARHALSPRVANACLDGEVMTGVALQPSLSAASGYSGYFGKVTALEEGFGFDFNSRDRLSSVFIRGDEAAQTPSDSVTYGVGVTKVAAQPGETAGTEQTLSSGLSAANPTADYLVGAAGYGDLDVSLHTTTTALGETEWDTPKVRVRAERWRNLLGNTRWLINGPGSTVSPCWTATGTTKIAQGTTSIYLTSTGNYAEGQTNGDTLVQVVDCLGYIPRGMSAYLQFYVKTPTGSLGSDKVTAEVEALNSGLTSLANTSQAFTQAASGTWASCEVILSSLPNNTRYVRVTFTFGGLQTAPQTIVCEPRLRVGVHQVSSFSINVLTNGSFETTLGSGWTLDSGAMASSTTDASPSAHCAVASGTTAGTSQIHQSYTLPAGWEYGGSVILTCWRGNEPATTDQGNVTLQALDPLSNVLATATTGFEAITAGTWVQRRLSFDVPEGTATIKIIAQGVDPGGSFAGYQFDEFSLSIAKDLGDPRYYLDLQLDAPSVQPVSNTWQQWHLDHRALYLAGVPHPLVLAGGAYNCSQDAISSRQLTFAPSAGTAITTVPGVGVWGNGNAEVTAWQFTRTGPVLQSTSESVGTRFMAPYAAGSFTAIVIFRIDEDSYGGACGLCGRRDNNAGWSLELDASGQVNAILTGTLGTVAAVRVGSNVADGGWHMAAITYSPSAGLTAIDDRGNVNVASPSVGEIYNSNAQTLMLVGNSTSTQSPMAGVQAFGYFFDGTCLTTAQVAAHWNYGVDPNGVLTTSLIDTVYCPGPLDDGGNETIVRLAPGQFPVGYCPRLSTFSANSTMGACTAAAASSQNLIQSFNFQSANWAIESGGAAPTYGITDASGLALGILVPAGTTAGLLAQGIPLGTGANLSITFWAKATSVNLGMVVVLENAAAVTKQSVNVTLTATWTRYVVSFNGWDASTVSGQIAFRSQFGLLDLELSHVVHVQMGTDVSPLIPHLPGGQLSQDVTATYMAPGQSMLLQLNQEGEIDVYGTHAGAASPPTSSIACLDDGSDSKNRRELLVDSTEDARFDHWDSTPAVVTSLNGSAVTWTTNFWLAGRWCASELLDQATNPFAGIVCTAPLPTQGYGRTATWTYDNTRMTRLRLGAGAQQAFSGFLSQVILRAAASKTN
jgi:hypothetical protein